MSGLGSTVQPEGEPGMQTHAVPLQAETSPDNPGQIAQSTAIQSLDQLLHTNWIYESTFTASTTMPAGTILFIKPIHPLEWNWPNRRVASMFNMWTGSGKIRYRPLATAWYGGSIRVGFLPPNLKRTDVQSLPLEVLTSYPNRDIDPKNTGWVDFRGPDQREVAYHYMQPFDDTDRQNFGGYIVFYVAGKLVTQAPEFTTIQFIVELAGDFMYDQPGPRALDNPVAIAHPLATSTDFEISAQPLLSSGDNGIATIVQVLPSTITSLPTGGLGMSAVGRPRALTSTPPTTGLQSLSDYITNQNALGVTGTTSISRWTYNIEERPDELTWHTDAAARINREFTDLDYFANAQLAAPSAYKRIVATDYIISDPDTCHLKTKTLDVPSDQVVLNKDFVMETSSIRLDTPINPALTPTGQMKLAPIVSAESIVIFGNTSSRFYAAQTVTMAISLSKFPTDMADSDISYLYEIVNHSGTPLALLRLNPNGIFTTTAATANVVYPGNVYLRYFGTLPTSSPLPPMGIQQKNLRRTIVRILRNKSDDAFEEIAREVDMY